MYILIVTLYWGQIKKTIVGWQSAHYEAEKAAIEYGRENVTLRRI